MRINRFVFGLLLGTLLLRGVPNARAQQSAVRIQPSQLFRADSGAYPIARTTTLAPQMNIVEVMQVFDAAQAEELAVVDEAGSVLGLVAESAVSRRYARELEQIQQELFGEG